VGGIVKLDNFAYILKLNGRLIAQIDVVHLIEIDVISFKSLETRFATSSEVESTQPPIIDSLGHWTKYLRCKHETMMTICLRQLATYDLSGERGLAFPSVAICGIKKINAQLQGPIHNGKTVLQAGLTPEIHRSQTKTAYSESGTAQFCIMHLGPPALQQSQWVLYQTFVIEHSGQLVSTVHISLTNTGPTIKAAVVA
jgi:hypothetical protein